MRRRDLFAGALALPMSGASLCAVAVPRGGGPIAAPDNDLMASLPDLLAIAGVPGISIGVVSKGRATWQAHLGMTGAPDRPVGHATIWKAASLSKQVSGYAALRLVDTGALDLDRPLACYLGDELADAAARRITARHVLTHSSGLPNWRRTRAIMPAFAPGSRFLYSGEGYFLLARCIERITGIGFHAYMRKAVFDPLGMDSSSYFWRADLAARLAPGHHWEGDAWDDAAWRDRLHARIVASGEDEARWTLDRVAAAMTATAGEALLPGTVYYPNPAMSLMTTAGDFLRVMARFVTGFGDGLDLSPRLRALAAAPAIRVNRAVSWGVGWGIETAGETQYLFQNGSLAGACTSFALLHPPSETGIVAFANHINGQRVMEWVFRAVTGGDHPVFLWA